MSIITIKKVENGFEMASDVQTTWGRNKMAVKNDGDANVKQSGKIFQVNGMSIGCAGTTAHINLLKIFSKNHSPKEMTCDEVIDWFVEFKNWVWSNMGIEKKDIEIHAIIVRNNKAFAFFDFMDVWEITDFDAVGSGMWLAIGAMATGADAEQAAIIAGKYDLFCGGEIFKLLIEQS